MISKYLIKLQNRKYHNMHKKSALKALNNIENFKGKTDPKLIKLSNEYAEKILGSKIYAPWLYVYSALQGDFKDGWIPDNFYGRIVMPKLKGDYGKLADRNMIVDSLLNTKLSLDILYYVNNLFWTPDYKVVDEKRVSDILFKNNEKIAYKIENSQSGRGVYFLNRNTFLLTNIKKLGNGVFQNYINQHSFFSEFAELSVATIRLTSICDDLGNIKVKAGYLRIGRNKDTLIKSGSAIKVPINLETGELLKYGYFPNWTPTEIHPDSKINFSDKIIPSFKECLKEVINMHYKVPFIRSIGWDIIVDNKRNVRLIEMNGEHNDIKFSEATQDLVSRNIIGKS